MRIKKKYKWFTRGDSGLEEFWTKEPEIIMQHEGRIWIRFSGEHVGVSDLFAWPKGFGIWKRTGDRWDKVK